MTQRCRKRVKKGSVGLNRENKKINAEENENNHDIKS
jgi:hypothetical protein